LFEALTLGVFQAGLSWSIVFGERDAFRRAFHGFDIAHDAAMTEQDVDRLLQDPSIIRNRAKIQATVENARAMSSASPSLGALARSYERTRKRAPRSLEDLPTSTPQPDAFAKQLKSQGYRFVGRTAYSRSCRTSAWSTTTSTGASEPPTTPNLQQTLPAKGPHRPLLIASSHGLLDRHHEETWPEHDLKGVPGTWRLFAVEA
jgi:DNA-3-methyladenine glycosylase I